MMGICDMPIFDCEHTGCEAILLDRPVGYGCRGGTVGGWSRHTRVGSGVRCGHDVLYGLEFEVWNLKSEVWSLEFE
jgi:hypothetical protein